MTSGESETWPDQADYRCPRSRLVPTICAFASAGYLAAAGWGLPVFSRIARELAGLPGPSVEPRLTVALLWAAWVAIAAAGLWQARQAVVGIMLARNSSVRVEPDRLTVVDYRGRSQSLRWQAVDELRARRALLVFEHGARADVYGDGRRLPISQLLERCEELMEGIVTRAGLSAREPHWWGVTYRRPQPPT